MMATFLMDMGSLLLSYASDPNPNCPVKKIGS
jgi:hypothetical protein